MKRQYQAGLRHKQQGAVLVLVTIAMIALIAMAGLALDGGHLLLNKTRLQNAVDAAALSAARTLSDFPHMPDTLDPAAFTAARAAALDTFKSNLGLADNHELNDAFAAVGSVLTVEFSEKLSPFNASGNALPYVRVRVEDLGLASWLLQIVGVDSKPVSASAVAGPIELNSSINKVLPIMVCGCDSEHRFPATDDCPGLPGESFYGYPYDPDPDIKALSDITVLKLSAGTGSDVGPGNFRLLNLGDAIGADDLRKALGGVEEYSVDIGENSEADTSTGNKAGPVSQGLNTRFGIYDGPLKEGSVPEEDPVTATYCSNGDCNVDAPTLAGPTPSNPNPLVFNNFDGEGNPIVKRKDGSAEFRDIFDFENYLQQYSALYGSEPCSEEGCRRREIALPVGDCTGTVSGTSQNVHIYNVACFFLLQEVGVGGDAEVFGQFTGSGCTAGGTFTDAEPTGMLPTKIVLFRDFGSRDS